MPDLVSDPSSLWLLAGSLLIAFEAFTTPGLGIFLLGLGALVTGLWIKAGLVRPDALPLQCAWFFAFTVLWTAALWRPLKKFRNRHNNNVSELFSNVLGQTAVITNGGIERGAAGQVLWSGTVMTAELDAASSAHYLPEGARVTITGVLGTTLSVIPEI